MKPINPITLADVAAGLGGSPSDEIRAASENDSRIMELYWHVQAASRRPGGLSAFLERIPGDSSRHYDGECYSLTPKDRFVETLKYLADESANFGVAGKCPSVIATAIYKLMSQDATTARAALADTKVSRTIFKELDLALQHKVPVPIIGDSRFGKTKSLSVWCEMRPGRARLVTVPESNRDWDFFAAHADALGIEYNDRTPTPRLKRAVEWVIHQAGFFICYDEAHFLVPSNYCKDTPPKRINWVRCQVIDKGIGCAFFATPQSMNQTLERFAAKTKYNFEQWLGRLAPPVVLADYCDKDELMAVAGVHFPEFPSLLLEKICSRAMTSEGYLKSMEFTARHASALARIASTRRRPCRTWRNPLSA